MEVNIDLWPMMHAFELSLLSILDTDGLPFFAKGKNFQERARHVLAKASGRVTYSLDMSSFDNSIRGALFKGELRAFKTLWDFEFREKDFEDALLRVSNAPDDVVVAPKCRKSGDL